MTPTPACLPHKYATDAREDGVRITIYCFSCSCIDPATDAPFLKKFRSRAARDRYADKH